MLLNMLERLYLLSRTNWSALELWIIFVKFQNCRNLYHLNLEYIHEIIIFLFSGYNFGCCFRICNPNRFVCGENQNLRHNRNQVIENSCHSFCSINQQVPLSVISAWILGIKMDLDFNLVETSSLAVSIIVTSFTLEVRISSHVYRIPQARVKYVPAIVRRLYMYCF